jgi:ABC-type transporter Mla subunit MlaD
MYVTGHHEQVDLDELLDTLRRRRTQLRADLENFDTQLAETRRRIEVFDRG